MTGEITWATGPANAFRSDPDRAPSIIRWEDPPRLASGRKLGTKVSKPDPFTGVAEALRAAPGRWAVVYEGDNGPATGVASRVRQALSPAFEPAGAFEATARKVNGTTACYARYVGDGAS